MARSKGGCGDGDVDAVAAPAGADDDDDDDDDDEDLEDRQGRGGKGLPADRYTRSGGGGGGGGAVVGEGREWRFDGAGADAAAVPAVATTTTQSSGCNSSVQGGGGSGRRRTGGDARGEEAAGESETTTSSPAGSSRQRGRGDNGSDTCGEPGGVDSRKRRRGGWRIGEGISAPVGGADAVWHRLEDLLEGEEAAAAAAGGRGSHVAGDGDTGRRREQVGQDRGGEVELEERREAVLEAVRWAWKVSAGVFLAGFGSRFAARCRV